MANYVERRDESEWVVPHVHIRLLIVELDCEICGEPTNRQIETVAKEWVIRCKRCSELFGRHTNRWVFEN